MERGHHSRTSRTPPNNLGAGGSTDSSHFVWDTTHPSEDPTQMTVSGLRVLRVWFA
jgi:hypothetical protein